MYSELANKMYYSIYGREDNKIELRGTYGDNIIGGVVIKEGEQSLPIVRSNFIPMLTNACISTNGGKDILLETFETKGNFSGDKLKYAGGVDETLTIGEINCEFEDIYYSLVMIMIYLWIMYMHYIGKAICDPEWSCIVHRIIDYTCSIYIFMLGTDNQTIIRWVRYGGCFPINIPFAAIQHSKELNSEELRKLSITFGYNFMCPMEPVSLTEFNMLSGPSLYERLKSYDLNEDEINQMIGGHQISLENAANILSYYPPYYERKRSSNRLPLKRFEEIVDLFEVKIGNDVANTSTGFEGLPNGEGINPLLLNRANGLIRNNFAGVPYIAEGNKLMLL